MFVRRVRSHRDRGLILEGFQGWVHVVGKEPEHWEEGESRDQTAGKNDFQATDLIRQPPKEDEKRRAKEQRGADEYVGRLVVELQRDLEEE